METKVFSQISELVVNESYLIILSWFQGMFLEIVSQNLKDKYLILYEARTTVH